MAHHKYISVLLTTGSLAWIGWIITILKFDPVTQINTALPLFFLTLLIALSCTFTILGFYFRVWLFKNEIFYKHINTAIRQGIIMAIITIICLLYKMMRVLTWWSSISIIVTAVLLEFYFSSKDSDIL